jgi:hypothetical protein
MSARPRQIIRLGVYLGHEKKANDTALALIAKPLPQKNWPPHGRRLPVNRMPAMCLGTEDRNCLDPPCCAPRVSSWKSEKSEFRC